MTKLPWGITWKEIISESFLAISLGLLAVRIRSWDSFPLLQQVSLYLMRVTHLSHHEAGLPAFFLVSGLVSASIFIALLLLLVGTKRRQPLVRAKGFLVIAATPMCAFYPAFITFLRTGYIRFNANAMFEFIEIILVLWLVLSAAGFIGRSALLRIVVLTFHYIFWAAIYWGAAPFTSSVLVFPLFGYLSAISWTAMSRSESNVSAQFALNR